MKSLLFSLVSGHAACASFPRLRKNAGSKVAAGKGSAACLSAAKVMLRSVRVAQQARITVQPGNLPPAGKFCFAINVFALSPRLPCLRL